MINRRPRVEWIRYFSCARENAAR